MTPRTDVPLADAAVPLSRLLTLTRGKDDRYQGASAAVGGRPVVFGGQLMAQTVIAGATADPGKQVRQLHTLFARAGAAGLPVEYQVEPLHRGRTLSSATVTAWQGTRVLCSSLVLLDAGDRDLMRQAEPMPAVSAPDALADAAWAQLGAQVRLADQEVDLDALHANGPPELAVWVRWPGMTGADTAHRAAITWYADPFIIAASMRPHEGLGQALAHTTLATDVVTHTMTFHDDVRADEWHLVWQRAAFAGSGRVHGHGAVFTGKGRHVASFVQEAVVRMAPNRAGDGNRT
jgi:acyl-CoA thioesterase